MRRVLVLGGTGWLGREIAAAAMRGGGAEVTCLARGESGAAPAGARSIRADRMLPGAYDRATGEWDEVVELSYHPRMVRSALESLGERAAHWTLVSSVSVYARNDEPLADESAELVEPADLTRYPDAKAHAEQVSEARLGERLLTARPGLIVGPGDPSDRFGYWPARLSRDGEAVVPSTAGRYVQVIDVADLAEWIVAAGSRGETGAINACGQAHTMSDFFAACREVTGFTGTLRAFDEAELLDAGANFWAGPNSLPLWSPLAEAAFAQRGNRAFLAAGGRLRPLEDTLRRTLQDERARGLDRERRAGLSENEERRLLEALRGER